jgi:hypothetical protein
MNVVTDFFYIIELDDLDGSKVVKFPTMRVGESGKMPLTQHAQPNPMKIAS